jgi:hypothetical protein
MHASLPSSPQEINYFRSSPSSPPPPPFGRLCLTTRTVQSPVIGIWLFHSSLLFILPMSYWLSSTLSLITWFFILSRVCGDYIRRVLDWQLDLLDHTQLHTITVYTLLQLTTVHCNTCRVFTLYLHCLSVFQYRRIRSPATLQLFSEDCCSARLLTHWLQPLRCRILTHYSLLSCHLTLQQLLLPQPGPSIHSLARTH